jgi:hypothetical protein
MRTAHPEILDAITREKQISPEMFESVKTAIGEYNRTFTA